MSRVYDVIKADILRAERNTFILYLFLTLVGYVGITFWLNSIRQTAAIWFVWALIIVQFFFLISMFVACSLRAKQCGFRHTWPIFIVLILSRVNDWELVLIPLLVIVMLVLSARNQNVSAQNYYLLPTEQNAPEIEVDEHPAMTAVTNFQVALATLDKFNTLADSNPFTYSKNDLISHGERIDIVVEKFNVVKFEVEKIKKDSGLYSTGLAAYKVTAKALGNAAEYYSHLATELLKQALKEQVNLLDTSVNTGQELNSSALAEAEDTEKQCQVALEHAELVAELAGVSETFANMLQDMHKP